MKKLIHNYSVSSVCYGIGVGTFVTSATAAIAFYYSPSIPASLLGMGAAAVYIMFRWGLEMRKQKLAIESLGSEDSADQQQAQIEGSQE